MDPMGEGIDWIKKCVPKHVMSFTEFLLLLIASQDVFANHFVLKGSDPHLKTASLQESGNYKG